MGRYNLEFTISKQRRLIMSRLILFIFLLLILFITLQYLVRGMVAPKKKSSRESEPEELVQDPCCQTYIPKKSALKKRIGGELLYFCNQGCMENYMNKTVKKG
jgi:YHS domain-containing protein